MNQNTFPVFDGFLDKADILAQYEGPASALDDAEVLIALYRIEGYEGSSFVLYRTPDGKFWEVNGSHCSCFGLEGQWKPEETTLAFLNTRSFYGNKDVPSLIQQLIDGN